MIYLLGTLGGEELTRARDREKDRVPRVGRRVAPPISSYDQGARGTAS